MEQTIFRNEQQDGSFIVQRIKDGEVQILKEVTSDTGEVVQTTNSMMTIQTITIIRHIGEKTTF